MNLALKRIHILERCSTNPNGMKRADATKHVLAQSDLNAVETEILLHALNILPSELV